jgi:uncharacterized protein (DUF697 family)/tellurite resistance protein
MDEEERQAIMTIALLAAFADGANDDRERAALQQVAGALGTTGGFDFPALYRDVLVSKPDLAAVTAGLATPERRSLAYEMAVTVCDADGERTAGEREFLARLGSSLGLGTTATHAVDERAKAWTTVASASVDDDLPQVGVPAGGTVQGSARADDAELDQMILKASITNAALELLPETLGSLAIIPLQMRLVYRIGKAHGYPMDRSHAKDFIATLGVGYASQRLESLGRKLLGGLLGTVAGGLGRGLGHQAASSGLTFATTYAIGRVAQRYYAAGRTLDATTLKATFVSLLEEARGIAPRYQPQIEQAANTIDTRNLAQLLRNV